LGPTTASDQSYVAAAFVPQSNEYFEKEGFLFDAVVKHVE
jgi:hypothetical protein